jgi:hypothetical protein
MDDELRASAVRKLRALADRLAAGDDVRGVFYAYDPERGTALCTRHESAREQAVIGIGKCMRAERHEIEWGIALPLEAHHAGVIVDADVARHATPAAPTPAATPEA